MTAASVDVARYTNDGVVVRTSAAAGAAIKATHADAKADTQEIEMFFDLAAVGQVLLDERFGYVSRINPPHIGVEVEEAVGLGTAIPVAPRVPCFTAVDEKNGLAETLRTRAFARDTSTERFSIELLG